MLRVTETRGISLPMELDTLKTTKNASQVGVTLMSPRMLILIVCCLGVLGCGKADRSPIPPKGPVTKRSRIQGLAASVGGAPRGNRFSPTAFDVSPPNMNWDQFRGDHSRSIAERDDLSQSWNEEKGIYWKTELPGRGASSPIILYKNVYLTAASGYGISPDDPGNRSQLRHHLICLDRGSGEYRWQRDIKGSPLTQQLTPDVMRYGFASSTPVADGQMVYAFFGASGVFAFDREGELVWQNDVGFQNCQFGSGASLVLYKDLLIVNASLENQTVYAFDKKTGNGVWKIDGINDSCSTPVIDRVPEGSHELIIVERGFVRGFDPKTGKELWYCEGIRDHVFATPFVKDGICFCNGGAEKQMMAIKLGGRGDVTQTHKLWEVPLGASLNSPIYLTGYLFLMSDDGVFQCFDARDGSLVESRSMPTAPHAYATPLLSGNSFYVPLVNNGVMVCEANSQFNQISHNQFANDPDAVTSSLAISEAALFMRSDRFLYRVSERDGPAAVVTRDASAQVTKEITPETRYDHDSDTGQLRVYNHFLADDAEAVYRAIVQPLSPSLSDDQAQAARKIVDQQLPKFAELRQKQRETLWTFLQSSPRNLFELNLELRMLDETVMSDVQTIRQSIIALVSP